MWYLNKILEQKEEHYVESKEIQIKYCLQLMVYENCFINYKNCFISYQNNVLMQNLNNKKN